MTRTNSGRKPTAEDADVTATGKNGESTTPSRDPEEIRGDIARTRADLGDTVEALAAKADVKARARSKATQVKARVQNKATQVKSRGQDKAAEVTARAKNTTAEVAEGAKNTGQRLAEAARRRPALLAGAVVAVTAAVGAVVMTLRRRAANAKRRPWQRWR